MNSISPFEDNQPPSKKSPLWRKNMPARDAMSRHCTGKQLSRAKASEHLRKAGPLTGQVPEQRDGSVLQQGKDRQTGQTRPDPNRPTVQTKPQNQPTSYWVSFAGVPLQQEAFARDTMSLPSWHRACECGSSAHRCEVDASAYSLLPPQAWQKPVLRVYPYSVSRAARRP